MLSRYGDENLTSWKNHRVHLWPTSFIRANYVQLPQQNLSRAPLVLIIFATAKLTLKCSFCTILLNKRGNLAVSKLFINWTAFFNLKKMQGSMYDTWNKGSKINSDIFVITQILLLSFHCKDTHRPIMMWLTIKTTFLFIKVDIYQKGLAKRLHIFMTVMTWSYYFYT